ncbi:MAG: tripartite tricarboxylate transporter substrate-binding protein [Burkholderiaceae bacterium]
MLAAWTALPPVARPSTVDTLKLVIGAPLGASPDLAGRSLGAAMIAAGQAQSAVYDNKSGGAGVAALLDFAGDERGNAAALMVAGSRMIGVIAPGEPLDALHRVTPIARLSSNALLLAVADGSPIRRTADLALRLQAQPTSITWGGGYRGSVEHALAGLFARAVGVPAGRLNHVPLAGGRDIVAALRDGHIHIGIGLADELLPLAGAGRLRALAVTNGEGTAGVASLRQQGIDLEAGHWHGVFAPDGLDDAIRLQRIESVRLATDALIWQQALARHRWNMAPLFGDDFGTFVRAEARRFDGVMRELGVRRQQAGTEALSALGRTGLA